MALAPPSNILIKTPVYRMLHIDCLGTLLERDAVHAPNAVPNDGLPYTGIHAQDVQQQRAERCVPCDPGGMIGDYIGFYFGPRSPMLLRVHTGRDVARVNQEHICYLVSSAQAIQVAGLGFVFTDRHSLTAFATWQNDLALLNTVDFQVAYAERWNTTQDHPDRQEKKQAEFLVHREMPWSLVQGIGVLNTAATDRVGKILAKHPRCHRPHVLCEPSWYY